jgi:hypothetical protein
MFEVCGGSASGVELLREKASSGTPKDLALWSSMVPGLHHALQGAVEAQADAEEDVDASAVPSIEDLQLWCDRAERAVEQLPWLLQFSTAL